MQAAVISAPAAATTTVVAAAAAAANKAGLARLSSVRSNETIIPQYNHNHNMRNMNHDVVTSDVVSENDDDDDGDDGADC